MNPPPSPIESPVPGRDRRGESREDPVRRAQRDTIYTLIRASEIYDDDTSDHLRRIRWIVECIAIGMGIDEDEAASLGEDAMLHDVGKLLIPRHILRKPDLLTPPERTVMEAHTVRGERLLLARTYLERAARIARSHHEAWDGNGYPDGLAGEAIPLEARITSTADVLDALMSRRQYKDRWPLNLALAEVVSLAGTKLDPRVVAALVRCNANGRLSASLGIPAQCAIRPDVA